VAAGVLTVFWGWLFFGLQDFATPMVNGQEFAVHYLMETGWGLLFLVLVAVPLAALVVRPGAAVPLTQVLGCSVSLARSGRSWPAPASTCCRPWASSRPSPCWGCSAEAGRSLRSVVRPR
jgi:hypothetical protein